MTKKQPTSPGLLGAMFGIVVELAFIAAALPVYLIIG